MPEPIDEDDAADADEPIPLIPPPIPPLMPPDDIPPLVSELMPEPIDDDDAEDADRLMPLIPPTRD